MIFYQVTKEDEDYSHSCEERREEIYDLTQRYERVATPSADRKRR